MKKVMALVALIPLFASPALALDSTQQMYTLALKLSSQGAYQEALDLLWRVVKAQPDAPMADESLFEIGSISERYLNDFDGAQRAYALLVERFPNSRSATRARTRLARLAEGRKGGDEPLRLFNDILQQYPKAGGEQSLARMRDLYAKWPEFSQRDHVLFWIAEEESRQRKYESALADYRTLIEQYPDSKWVYFARGKIGRAYIEMRDFENAIHTFEAMAALEGEHPGAGKAAAEQIRLVHRFRLLRQFYYLGLAIMAAALLLWVAGTRWRNLRRGDLRGACVDAGILALLYAILVFSVSGTPPRFQTTLIHTGVAVCAAAFLNSLFVSSRSFSRAGRALITLVAFLAVTSTIYVAYYRLDTVNKLYDSIQNTLEERGRG
jgi:TolA-binding protein